MTGDSGSGSRENVLLVATPEVRVEGRVRFGRGRLVGGRSGGGGWVRVTPVAVVVRRGDGPTREVRITDSTHEALAGLGWVGIGIALGAITLLGALRRIDGRPRFAA